MELKSEFIGTKRVLAQEMNRQQYNDYRKWTLPDDENGEDPGYLVEYLDGGKPNHPDHAGYISWSPAEQFDSAYRATNGLTFGLAVEALKRGKRVARAGWNGKGMWLSLVPAVSYDIGFRLAFTQGEELPELLPWIGMKTADNKFVPWLASQTDVLADDWILVP